MTIDKTGWGEGPWQDEPDGEIWQDEATGLSCAAYRHPHAGFWRGYVAVPPGHALHGKSVNDVQDLHAYGGIVHAGGGPPDPVRARLRDELWLFGFDGYDDSYSNRFGVSDLAPGLAERDTSGTYRTLDFVKHWCRLLAEQLAGRASTRFEYEGMASLGEQEGGYAVPCILLEGGEYRTLEEDLGKMGLPNGYNAVNGKRVRIIVEFL